MSVGSGAVVSGVAAYAFLVLTARQLGPGRDAALAALWSLAYLAGPGFFLPVEQELARVVSVRNERGLGSGVVVRKAAMLGAAAAAVLAITTLVVAAPATHQLFDGQPLLLVGFILALPGYLCMHLVWGINAGSQRLGSYARVTALEGVSRLLIAAVLLLVGVRTAGPYGIALGVAPLIAATAGLGSLRTLRSGGPRVGTAALACAFGALLGGSLLNQFLLMAPPLAVKILGPADDPAAGRLLAGMVLVRVPLFLFNAALATLLPGLSAHAGSDRPEEFRALLRTAVLAVAGIGAVLVLGATAIAPSLLAHLFGPAYRLGSADLGLLAAACVAYMVALTLSQGLIAQRAHGLSTAGWLSGAVVFVTATILLDGHDGLRAVEIGFLIGSAAAAAGMACCLRFASPARRLPPLDARASVAIPSAVVDA
jgi:O-antigen/teichoic acid export membrane protein